MRPFDFYLQPKRTLDRLLHFIFWIIPCLSRHSGIPETRMLFRRDWFSRYSTKLWTLMRFSSASFSLGLSGFRSSIPVWENYRLALMSDTDFSKSSIHVQYTRTESDRLGYATVRLTGSPIARDLEKYTEVFTEGVKCWRIDSIGHGRTRPVSLCVGSTERKSDRERLRKNTLKSLQRV